MTQRSSSPTRRSSSKARSTAPSSRGSTASRSGLSRRSRCGPRHARGSARASRSPQAEIELARQASTLVAFDFITGNWDRYSGENVGLDSTGAHVLFIDNDAAFLELPPKEQLARNKALLDATDRFSRAFVEGARKLDAERLAAVFGEEAPGRPLLSTAVVSIVARRLEELVAIVDAKIAARGEAETLYFR